MTDVNYNIIPANGARKPIYMWNKHVVIDANALEQAANCSYLPIVHDHIALMPDAHWGLGATIGSVIATHKAIIPSAVGVDIGCGMIATRLDLTASDLPDNLAELRAIIEDKIPHGRTDNGGSNDRGAFHDPRHGIIWTQQLLPSYDRLCTKTPGIRTKTNPLLQLGTLGTGNHFIEICIDEAEKVWIMLHSGSRGIGNRIGNYFITKAKEEMEKWGMLNFLPDKDLAYMPEHTEIFKDYMDAVGWAQNYAAVNRTCMMSETIKCIEKFLGRNVKGAFDADPMVMAINCHHNYVAREKYNSTHVYITRKGAIDAHREKLGIIPGSMGAKSFIVQGKGNLASFNSCSHGAGRLIGRNQAMKKFTVEDHIKATNGVECRKDEGVIDETPGAYKDIDAVMASQSDLVDILYTLKQILCVKG